MSLSELKKLDFYLATSLPTVNTCPCYSFSYELRDKAYCGLNRPVLPTNNNRRMWSISRMIIGRAKLKWTIKICPKCYFIQHKCNMHQLGIEASYAGGHVLLIADNSDEKSRNFPVLSIFFISSLLTGSSLSRCFMLGARHENLCRGYACGFGINHTWLVSFTLRPI
jgi:hypothetical protein